MDATDFRKRPKELKRLFVLTMVLSPNSATPRIIEKVSAGTCDFK
jgi:hypothetical protein